MQRKLRSAKKKRFTSKFLDVSSRSSQFFLFQTRNFIASNTKTGPYSRILVKYVMRWINIL